MLLVSVPLLGTDGGGHGPDWLALIAHLVNFAILMGIFVVLGRRPIKEMLKQRRRSLKLSIDSAQKEREKAAQELAFYEQKLVSIDDEIRSIEANYRIAGEQKAEELRRKTQETINRQKDQGVLQQAHAQEKMRTDLMLTLSEAVLAQVETGLRKTFEDKRRENVILEQFKIG